MSEQKDPAYPPDQPYPQQQAYPPPPPGYPVQQGYPAQSGYPLQQQQQQQQQPQQGYTTQTYVPQAVYTPQGQVTIKTGAPQHQSMVRSEIRTEPNDYICFSIFVMLFCCLPLGIIALIKSMDVRSLVAVQDFAAASRASQSAKNWSIASLVTGLVIEVVAIIILIVWFVVFGGTVAATVSDIYNYQESDYYYG